MDENIDQQMVEAHEELARTEEQPAVAVQTVEDVGTENEEDVVR